MKKVLLIGLILAICLLAFPQGVAAYDPSPVEVTANVNKIMSCTAVGLSEQALVRGNDNVINPFFTFTVTSTNNWQLTAANNTGHMIPTPPGTFRPTDATPLVANFSVQNKALTYLPLGGGAVEVDTGLGDKSSYTRGMKQPVGLTDYALSVGKYQITIQFTCTATDI